MKAKSFAFKVFTHLNYKLDYENCYWIFDVIVIVFVIMYSFFGWDENCKHMFKMMYAMHTLWLLYLFLEFYSFSFVSKIVSFGAWGCAMYRMLETRIHQLEQWKFHTVECSVWNVNIEEYCESRFFFY